MNGVDELLQNTLPPEDVYSKLEPAEQNIYNYKILKHLLVTFAHQPRLCAGKFVSKRQAIIGGAIFGAFLLGLGIVNWQQIRVFLGLI